MTPARSPAVPGSGSERAGGCSAGSSPTEGGTASRFGFLCFDETVDLSLVEGIIPDLRTLESLAGGACAVTLP